MLGRPDAGWTDITIGKYIGTASYLDDVPIETMDAFLKYFQGAPFQVTYDAEGYNFGLITFDDSVYIVDNKNDNFDMINTKVVKSENGYFGKYETTEKVLHVLAKECVNDVRQYIDGWVDWFSYEEDTPEEKEIRKKMLLDKADILEAYIKTENPRREMLEKIIQECLQHIRNGETEFKVDAENITDEENQYIMQEVEKRMSQQM